MKYLTLRDLLCYKLRAINNYDLHKDFQNDDKKLTPIVFSHGLRTKGTLHFTMISFLVSHGCIVYAPDFTDKSCSHFKDYTKNPSEDVYFEDYDKEIHKCDLATYRRNQLFHRIKDIKAVLDYIKLSQKTNKAIDLTKLVKIGHSLGGIAAIEACLQFKNDFKLCITLDPYFYAKWPTLEEVNEGISQPILNINSELHYKTFSEYDHKAANQIFFDKSCKLTTNFDKDMSSPNYFVMMKASNHQNQLDLVLFKPRILEMAKAVLPTTNHDRKCKEMVNLILAFLSEHKYLPIDTMTKVKDQIVWN